MKWLGLIALACTAVHYAYHLYHGRPWDLLWACHIGSLLVGFGWLIEWPTVLAIGFLWLGVGVPLWVLDLAMGAEFTPTSLLTHSGGLVVGLLGLTTLGTPTGAWWKAVLALAALQQLCRWTTPAVANVNVAFAVYAGWERWFPSYWIYCLLLLLVLGAAFFGLEQALRRFVGPDNS